MDYEIKTITVTRSFTYDVKDIADSIREVWQEDPTLDDVLDQIHAFAEEDLRSPMSRHDVVWVDQDGKEL